MNSDYSKNSSPLARRIIPWLLGLACWAVGNAPVTLLGQDSSVWRDWEAHPAVIELDTPPEIDVYALGDVHGDYDVLCHLLVGAGIIKAVPDKPESVQWTAGNAILVCTGDVIDRYTHSLPVIALLRALQTKAHALDGRVIVTLGNHEAEFLAAGGNAKKPLEFEKELRAAGISPADVAAGRDKDGIGQFLRELPAAARLNDWFFCHAGNTHSMSMAQLKSELEKQIGEKGFGAPILSDPDSLLEARMHPRAWWEESDTVSLKDVKPKNQKGAKTDLGQERLEADLKALGVAHLVFGHQPGQVDFLVGPSRKKGEMFTKYDGLVFMIDTGMSRGVDSGRGAVLKITRQHDEVAASATAIYADGQQKVLWPVASKAK